MEIMAAIGIAAVSIVVLAGVTVLVLAVWQTTENSKEIARNRTDFWEARNKLSDRLYDLERWRARGWPSLDGVSSVADI